MGVAAAFIPYIVAAVGTAAAVVNQRNVAHQQDQTLAAQIRAQSQKQQLADARTAQLIQSEGQSTDTQDKAKSQAAYNAQIAKVAPQATTALATPAGASAAYKKSGSDAALGVTQYGQQQGDWLSSIEAPQLQRQRDVIQNIDPYRNDIGLIARQNAGDNFLYNLKLRNIQPNPWLSLVSGAAGGVSNAMAKGGYGQTNDAAYTPYSGQYGDLPDITNFFSQKPVPPFSYSNSGS